MKIVDLRPTLTHSSRAPERKPAAPRKAGGKKPLPLKTRRRRLRAAIIAGGVLVFLLCVWGVHWYSYRPSMRIQTVSVRGAMLQDPNEIIDYAHHMLAQSPNQFIAHDGILSYPKDELNAALMKDFPRLKSVRIGRAGPFSTTLIINIDERSPFALWCTALHECYAFDDAGLLFAPADRAGKPQLPYVFSGGVDESAPIGKVFLPQKLQGILDLLQRMREARFEPGTIEVNNDQDFSVDLQNGYTIKASFNQDPDTILHNLELVAVSPQLRGKEQDLEYIDLRFGDRVYYKFKDQPDQEQAQ